MAEVLLLTSISIRESDNVFISVSVPFWKEKNGLLFLCWFFLVSKKFAFGDAVERKCKVWNGVSFNLFFDIAKLNS